MTHENAEDLTANLLVGRSVKHGSTIGFRSPSLLWPHGNSGQDCTTDGQSWLWPGAYGQKYMTKTNLNRVRRMRQRVEAMAEQARSDPLPLVSATAKSLDEIARRLHIEEQWQQRHVERRKPKARDKGQLTPIEWLAGAELPTIFEQRFSLPASFGRDDAEQPTGPLIDFVAAVLGELGLEYSRKSIARAVTRFNGAEKPARE